MTDEDLKKYDLAFFQCVEEVHDAQAKHSSTFESSSDDRRLRIMVEEVGEIADAIQSLEDVGPDDPLESELDRGLRNSERIVAIDHLKKEIAQVGACCLRWLQVLGAVALMLASGCKKAPACWRGLPDGHAACTNESWNEYRCVVAGRVFDCISDVVDGARVIECGEVKR